MPAPGNVDPNDPTPLALRRALLLGLAHGILLFLSFPPVSFWPACVVAILPFALLSDPRRRVRKRHALVFSTGPLLFWGASSWWIGSVSTLGFIPLVVYLALHHGAALWACNRIARWTRARFGGCWLWLVVPVVWTGVEYLRGSVLWDGYPWYLVGVPLINTSPWFWLPSAAGVYVATLWCAILAAVLADLWARRQRAAIAGLVVLASMGGAMILGDPCHPGASPTVRIAVVQTNVTVSNKISWTPEDRVRNYREFVELSRRAAEFKPDLIVWPETMYPGYYLDLAVENGQLAPINDYRAALLAEQASLGVPMIVGAIGADALRIEQTPEGRRIRQDALFNSAFLIDHGDVGTRYDKLHLTPFGEVMPYISSWPWLEKQLLAFGAHGMSFDLDPGAGPVVFEIGPAPMRVVTPICFEVTMHHVCKALVFEGAARRADVLINVTNDGWFGASDAGRRSHALHARWRSGELGTPMVRAANTGVSVAFDHTGRPVAPLPGSDPCGPRQSGVAAFDVKVGCGPAPGVLVGGVPGLACACLAAAALLASFFAARKAPIGETPPGPAAHPRHDVDERAF